MYKKRDLSGNTYGNLTVIKSIGHYRSNDKHFWSLVRCKCGNEFPVQDTVLTNGRRVCCTECSRKLISTHHKTNSRIYHVYSSMKARCYNPKNKNYKNYGGRGIGVCEEWLKNPEAFINWAYENGYDENAEYMQCTLERKNVNENYCPQNCCWVDLNAQALNKTDTIYMTYKGEKLPVQTVARITGIKASTIIYRIRHGYSDEEAIMIPISGEISKERSKNHELKRKTYLTDKRTHIKQEFESCSSASRFLGFNDCYLGTKAYKLGTNRFEVGGYYVEIGELYN